MQKGDLSILLVDDDLEDLLLAEDLLREGLKGVSLELDRASSFDEALAQIEKAHYDALLFDYRLGPRTGLELLQAARARGVDAPVVLLTGQGDEEVAVEAMKLGAADYLIKSKASENLFRNSIRHAIEMHEQERLRHHAEDQLRQMNEKLEIWVKELERRIRESASVSELDGALQTCVASEEVYAIIAQRFSELFPGRSGALCMFDASRNLVEAVAVWGEDPPRNRAFTMYECWGFRRARSYLVQDALTEIVCPHLRSTNWSGHLCVPMLAYGATLGVLVLQGGPAAAGEEPGRSTDFQRRFVETLTEHLALALANVRLREALRVQSVRDPLTRLFNRRYMEESLERSIAGATRHNLSVSVLLLDLDGFKEFNDAHGHAAGDALLREMGEFLLTHTRKEDVACRYGGDEFVLILPEMTPLAAAARAEQIRHAIKGLVEQRHEAGKTTPTLSIGIAAAPEHGVSSKALLEAADAALYRAKREGRDRVIVSDPVPLPQATPEPADFEKALVESEKQRTTSRGA